MQPSPPLKRFVDDELGRSAALVSRVLAGTLQLLRESKDSAQSASERSHSIELIAALQNQAELYQNTFVEALRIRVDGELRGASGDTPDLAGGLGGLELMDEALVDVDIEISRATQ